MKLNVIYEDNHIIVCYKPEGVLSQKETKDSLDMTYYVKKYLKEKYNKPGEVYLGLLHRLDRNTSGLMVFAKTSKAAKRLSEDIKNHETFSKYYLAIVSSKMEKGYQKDLVNYLSKDEIKKISYEDKSGKLSKLHYEVLDTKMIHNKSYSLINVKLDTGRFHQIRSQMSLDHHPLYNDLKYHGLKEEEDSYFPLSSYHLSFIHPVKKERMDFYYFKPTRAFLNFYDKDDFLAFYKLEKKE